MFVLNIVILEYLKKKIILKLLKIKLNQPKITVSTYCEKN